MIIYGALIIPIITAIILYWYFKKETTWWEMFIPTIVSIICISISKYTIEKIQVSSTEYWGSFVDRVEYYEPWNEWVTQKCPRTCCCDSMGQNCSTETYDCSYCRYHPEHYDLYTTTGEFISLNKKQYDEIKKRLGNSMFIDLNRDYYTIDGNEYCSTWRQDSLNAIPVSTRHTYENRIKASDHSVFNYGKVSDEDIKKYDLKNYPDITDDYKMRAVIGDNSKKTLSADSAFQFINAKLGHKKQFRAFVLLFKNQPIEAGILQEWLWTGGNKNEFIICIGTDKKDKVKWCRPFSWTRSEILKSEVKSFVQNQDTLNLFNLAKYVYVKADKEFERRSFKEFDYLTVEPPLFSVIITYIITIVVNILTAKWIIKNDFN